MREKERRTLAQKQTGWGARLHKVPSARCHQGEGLFSGVDEPEDLMLVGEKTLSSGTKDGNIRNTQIGRSGADERKGLV